MHLVESEVARMSPVLTGPTQDRSVIGIMVDFAKAVPFHLQPAAWDESTLPFVEAQLAETPCHAGKRDDQVVWPSRDAVAILEARWGTG